MPIEPQTYWDFWPKKLGGKKGSTRQDLKSLPRWWYHIPCITRMHVTSDRPQKALVTVQASAWTLFKQLTALLAV